jgi:hypothetical protein
MWRTIIFGAALAVLALVNDQLLWLPPLTFAALAIAVLLIVVAVNAAVALVAVGSATVTPFLAAGVLPAASLIKRAAERSTRSAVR